MAVEYKKNNIFFTVSIFLAVPFFGFYTTKIGLSPIYLTFFLAAICAFLGFVYGADQIKLGSVSVAAIALLVYLFVMFFLRWSYPGFENISAWVNISFSLIYLLLVESVIDKVEHDELLKVANLAICFSIILLLLEFVYRISNPSTQEELGHENREDLFWYAYKASSFMYPDSNSVGLFAACLFVFVLQFKNYCKFASFYLMPIFFLLLGTLSRASIISAIVVFLYMLKSGKIFKFGFLLITTLLTVLALFLADFSDESLSARFWIASLVVDYVAETDFISLLMGGGPGNSEQMINVGAHLLPFTWFLELGALGAFLQITLWYFIWRRAPKAVEALFLVFVLNGFSFTTFAFPWFYVMAIMLIYFHKEACFGK